MRQDQRRHQLLGRNSGRREEDNPCQQICG